jgi:pimeloyl-ACP methyl ester carboxylesterase
MAVAGTLGEGVHIHFVSEGRGEPVVLIHGFLMDAEVNWIKPGVVKSLAETHRVIALDLRGHGKSAKPYEAEHYGEKMVKDVVRLMDYLEIHRAHIVGYSFGAAIAMKMLVTEPGRFKSATIAGSSGYTEYFDSSWPETQTGHLDEGMSVLDALMATFNHPPERKPVLERALGYHDARVIAAITKTRQALIVTQEQLKSNAVPTLVIHGSQEERSTREAIEKLDGVLSNARFQTIDGANHWTAFRRPEFSRALKEFFHSVSEPQDGQGCS